MPLYRVRLDKQYLIVVNADNAKLAGEAAKSLVEEGQSKRHAHVFDTYVSLESVMKLGDAREVD